MSTSTISSPSSSVSDRPAVDASPLIFLSRADLLDLLRLAGAELVVPRPVFVELERRGEDDPAVRGVRDSSWLQVADPPPTPPEISTWDLGPGEDSVLAWASAHSSMAILDDLAGRRCAQSLGIAVRGTLGLVLLAERRGKIPSARAVLESLREAGMYLSDSVLDRALRMAAEEPSDT